MKKKIGLLCVFILTGVLLTACGKSSENVPRAASMLAADDMAFAANSGGGSYATNDVYLQKSEALTEMEGSDQEMPVEETQAPQVETGAQSARKLIRNANMVVETEEFDSLLSTVEEKVKNLGGYMENYSTSKNSRYYGGNENRYASMTIRIPSDSYDRFVNEVSEVSNVLNRNESVQDVTLQYVDLESHKKVLLTEQTRLLELLEQAADIEDIIAIESRLSDVRYQIESMESQLRTYDNQVDYSTIYLNINEVKQLTPVQEQNFWEKISTGFVNSWKVMGTGFKNIFIGLIVASPFLMVTSAIVIITLLIIKLMIKRNNRKKNKDGTA